VCEGERERERCRLSCVCEGERDACQDVCEREREM